MSSTNWFRAAKWGIFAHLLAGPVGGSEVRGDTPVEEWNAFVDGFDVEALADQLADFGARYYCIGLGQNSGHYCSPNATYDSITGITPSKLSKRDLVNDVADAMALRGIKTMVYAPATAPGWDEVAMEKLEWEWGFKGKWPDAWSDTWKDPKDPKRTGKRLVEFQIKWESILREWSLRWGSKISGWWVDGCYFADEMYRHPDAPNFQSFAAAMKAGNPDSIVAFNPGVYNPIITMTEYEDYTAGETADMFPICPGPRVEHAQYHILSYLGQTWGSGEPRFVDEFVLGYTKDLISKGGVMTWDVPFTNTGLVAEPFRKQIKQLKSI
jgi:hypothetical protein